MLVLMIVCILRVFISRCSFSVRSVMAPVSQLLVYYVTSQGEPVSDVISFDVKLLQRQVRYGCNILHMYTYAYKIQVCVCVHLKRVACREFITTHPHPSHLSLP